MPCIGHLVPKRGGTCVREKERRRQNDGEKEAGREEGEKEKWWTG